MKLFGHINTEGGPILLANLSDVVLWRGIDGGIEGSDYDNICQLFNADDSIEGMQIEFGGGHAILWEAHGGGTVYVYMPESGHDIILLKPWVSDPDNISALAEVAFQKDTYIGSIAVRKGATVLFDSTENTSSMSGIDRVSGRIEGDFVFVDSNLILSLNVGTYHCYHDYVEASTGLALARRLYLEFADES